MTMNLFTKDQPVLFLKEIIKSINLQGKIKQDSETGRNFYKRGFSTLEKII